MIRAGTWPAAVVARAVARWRDLHHTGVSVATIAHLYGVPRVVVAWAVRA